MDLTDKTVLLTGANRGIGLALAHRLAREPVRLLCAVREPGSLPSLLADGPGELREVTLDLGSRESVAAGLAALGDERAGIDVLINNAGSFTGGLLEEQDLDAIYDAVQVNVAALAHLTHDLLPDLLRRPEAKIVNQGSIVADVHFPGISTYAATKAAVQAFSECLRRELADTSVSVLHLVTGGQDTDMLVLADEQLRAHTNPDGWERQDPDDWADRIVEAIHDDDETLHAGKRSELVERLAALGPAKLMDLAAGRAFSR